MTKILVRCFFMQEINFDCSKQVLRNQILKKKKELLGDDKHRQRINKISLDQKIKSNILSLVEYQSSAILLMYMANSIEVNLDDIIIKNISSKEKKIAIPKCHDDNIMDFYFIENLESLVVGKFGIREPSVLKQKFYTENFLQKVFDDSDSNKVLMFLPGVAFDKKGYRIGYGKGYYDKYLSRIKNNFGNQINSEIFKIGLCYDFALVDSIKFGSHDESVDILVTETQVIRFR